MGGSHLKSIGFGVKLEVIMSCDLFLSIVNPDEV